MIRALNSHTAKVAVLRKVPTNQPNIRLYASGHGDDHGKDKHDKHHDDHEHHDHEEIEVVFENQQSPSYKPGTDSYAYENPWPKLNKGRLDWLFQDGWRRPLAKDQGGYIRREWIWFNNYSYDEHKDWYKFHQFNFLSITVMFVFFTFVIGYMKPDWPGGNEWAYREAHLEIERRRQAGLPLISKDFLDPERVAKMLPSEEELRDFDIII